MTVPLARAAFALTLALGLAVSGPADAAPATATAEVYSNFRVLYTAAPGQTNQVSATLLKWDGTDLNYVIDDVVPITIGAGCSYPDDSDHTKVTCSALAAETQDPYDSIQMDVGDGNDTVTFTNESLQVYFYANIYLGTGNDKLTDFGLAGGPDPVIGGVDGSNVWGQAGRDTISVGVGAVAHGGDDNDTIFAIGDVAIADGGKGTDVIHGGPGPQALNGGNGNDSIFGGTGDDDMSGGKGNDILYGNSGNDRMYGNSGNDTLYGGPGTDTLSGGPGTNVLHQN
jgi:Ca2+-binding RTX toxin-like protein